MSERIVISLRKSKVSNSWYTMPNVDTTNKDSEEKISLLDAFQKMEERLNVKLDGIKLALEDRLENHEGRLDNIDSDLVQLATRIQTLEDERAVDRVRIEKLTERQVNMEAHQRRLNLKFIGLEYEVEEDVVLKIRDFFVNYLELDHGFVTSLRFRDVHRLGVNKKGVRPIIVAFLNQNERNTVFKNAYKLKGKDFVIQVDLPFELVDIQNELLAIRKEINKANKDALAIITYKSYKPVLTVKYNGKVQSYTSDMQFQDLQPGDRRRH